MKGKPTFMRVDSLAGARERAQDIVNVSVDTGSIVQAIHELTAAVKAVKPEVRIDLPALTPTFDVHPAPVPVTVTVPELPPNPPVMVTVPDFKLSWKPFALTFLAIVSANIAVELVRFFILHR